MRLGLLKSSSLPPPAFSAFLLLVLLSLVSLFFFSSSEQIAYRDVDLQNPVQHLISSQFVGSTLSCERVRITGLSRLKLGSYASSFLVMLKASDDLPERYHGKVELCFHRNASIELCQCEKDEWRNLQTGQWSTVMSPYLDGYIDVKFINGVSGSITISLEEEFQQWRLLCLGIGFALLLLAPVVSNWVPFYYSSSMALGIMLVVLFLLFQGMKLLPTGKRNIFYLTIYGSVLGAGSYLLHQFSIVVNGILVNFGLSEEMYNPLAFFNCLCQYNTQIWWELAQSNLVSVFVLVGIILVGAALGYWIVRKFVLSEDGSVDAGIAQFVKWAMRIMGMVFIFQSTLDIFLAVAAVITFWNICSALNSSKRRQHSSLQHGKSVNENLWKRMARQATTNHQHAQFLYPSGKAGFKNTAVGSLSGPYSWSRSPPKGRKRMGQQREQIDYYSTFHNIPKFKWSKKDWEEFTEESTRDGLAKLSSAREFTEWMAENAHRIRLEPKESSDDYDDDESVESSSGSSEETVVEGSTALSFLKWL